ncbi:hypothetical protein MATL_G00148160 [Megalops atlanticus]|uniref:Ubiquitin-like protease family profile domain-containing protein n=1 Tax=Megalops atlanticus TaxID=7932 RepID=A0A9D3PRM5_MEGAT|nr:hypothetical protein MATL_G00148160 [Megalops atlanticus]
MYEWIVGGISSIFGPHIEQRCTSWPRSNNRPTPSSASRDVPRREILPRPAKRHYQSVHASGGRTECLEIKRPKRDVVVSVFKKTVAGVAGLLHVRNPFVMDVGSEDQRDCTTHEVCSEMGVDEVSKNNLNSWISKMDVKMEKKLDVANNAKDRSSLHFHPSTQPSSKTHNGPLPYSGNPDKSKARNNRRSFQFLPPRPPPTVKVPSDTDAVGMALSSQGHKPRLAVEEALKESDREHYRLLVEMVSEKYTSKKPLPCGRVKPFVTPLPVDMHKPTIISRTCNGTTAKPGPMRANPSVSVWRDVSSTRQNTDSSRRVDTSLGKPRSSEVGRADSKHTTKEKTEDELSSSASLQVTSQSQKPAALKQTPDVDLSSEIAARLNLVDREPVASSLTAAHPERPVPESGRGLEFPRLTKEMLQEVSAALGQKDPNLVLSSAFKLRITQRDLATLRDSSWLNDEVINFYLNLVASRSEQEGGRKVYAFSTFFFPKLHGGGHTAVRRWTKAVDLFAYDIILVPLHLGVHWSLAVIDLKAKSVKCYDSMGQRHDEICRLLLLYLKDEYKTKKNKDLEVSKWEVTSLRSNEIPQQNNGSDCGVFACKYADYIARGWPLTFTQSHMPYFRKRMIWEILNRQLL